MAFNFDNFQRLVAAEAGNQGVAGQNAVAATILNRMADGQFPDSLDAVASQKNQFEPWRKYGGFKRMPSLSKGQQDSLRSFVNNYSADTDPTGGALFFQNPAITAKRGTKFAQRDGKRIGDQVFSRTYGNEPTPSTPPVYRNTSRAGGSEVEAAKQNILNLTRGHRSEREGQKIVSTFSDNDIIDASNKFDSLLANLNPTANNIPLEDVGVPSGFNEVPLEEIDRSVEKAEPTAPPMENIIETPNNFENQMTKVHKAYDSGQMSPEQMEIYEQSLDSGEISRPKTAPSAKIVPASLFEAYNSGSLTPEQKATVDASLANGEISFPEATEAQPEPQERTLAEGLQRGAELTTRAVLSGLEGALGIVYNPVAVLMNQALNDENQIPMLGNRVNEVLTEAGIAEPENMTEEIVGRVASAMSGAGGVAGVAGQVGKVAQGATKLVSKSLSAQPTAQIVSAGTGEVASQGVKAAGGGDAAQLVAGVAGAIAGGSAAGVRPKTVVANVKETSVAESVGDLVNKASSGGKGAPDAAVKLAKAARTNVEAKEAAGRLGIELPIDVFSDDTIVKQAAGLTRSKVGSEASAIWEDTVKKAVDKADNVLTELANKKSISEVSESVKKSLDDSLTVIKRGEGKLYKEVSEEVGARTKIDAKNTRAYLTSKVKDLGGVKKLDSGDKALYVDVFNPHRKPNYAVIDNNIRKINAAKGGKQNTFADANDFDLDELASNLRKDRLAHVEKFGGEETRKKLTSAHELTSRKKDIQKRLIAGFGKDQKGSVAKMLSTSIMNAKKGDISGLNKVLDVIPKELQKESLLSAINQSATARIGGRQVFGFSQFVDFYSGLRKNPPLYNKIISVVGKDAHKTLRDLYSVSKRITDARGKVITTGKANQELVGAMQAEGLVGSILQSSIGGKAVKAAGAGGGAVVGGPAGAAGGAALADFLTKGGKDRIAAAGRLFSSDDFKILVSDVADNPAKYRSKVKKLSKSAEFKKWAKASKISNPENWLLGVVYPNQETKTIEYTDPKTGEKKTRTYTIPTSGNKNDN